MPQSHAKGCDRAGCKRDENLDKALNERAPVRAQDRPYYDCGDEEIDEVGRLGESRHLLNERRRQKLMCDQERGQEDRHQRRSADHVEDGNPPHDLGAGEATDHEDGDHHRHLAGNLPQHGEGRDQPEQDHVDRQGDDADPDFHETL
jgi:hypothetical protein